MKTVVKQVSVRHYDRSLSCNEKKKKIKGRAHALMTLAV